MINPYPKATRAERASVSHGFPFFPPEIANMPPHKLRKAHHICCRRHFPRQRCHKAKYSPREATDSPHHTPTMLAQAWPAKGGGIGLATSPRSTRRLHNEPGTRASRNVAGVLSHPTQNVFHWRRQVSRVRQGAPSNLLKKLLPAKG